MLLVRILLALGLLFLTWRLLRRFLPAPTQRAPEAFAPTVRCEQCGVVIPTDQARMISGKPYCEEHAAHD